MKLRQQSRFFNRTILLSLVTIVIIFGCNTEEDELPKGDVEDLSAFAQTFLGMKLSSTNALSQTSDVAINQSFRSTMNGARDNNFGFLEGSVSGNSTSDGESDSILIDDGWVSCAVITETQNDDGSQTWIYDYGDGCHEGWGDYWYFMHGKFTQNYQSTSETNGSVYSDSYVFKTVYDNYGGNYDNGASEWFNDGNSYYEGHSMYDTLSQTFSGYYDFSDTLTYGYNDVISEYLSAGKSAYDENGSKITENEYKYSEGDNFYHSKVTVPLVSDYGCNYSGQGDDPNARTSLSIAPYYWLYVSGHEIITYSQDGVSGSFEIDYGNGQCDNIAYITENGLVIEVNMSEMVYHRF